MDLFIDLETYSSVDLKKSGMYKYVESLDFEILLIGYAIGDSPVEVIDLTKEKSIPEKFLRYYNDPSVRKWASNAAFERNCFRAYGMERPTKEWYCSAVLAAYCGLPLSLDLVSKALDLGSEGKLSTGKALINYFCSPIKPTKVNGMRKRNFPWHDPTKWSEFIKYLINDVKAERQVVRLLSKYEFPEFERNNYLMDQDINDLGVMIDQDLVNNAIEIDNKFSTEVTTKMEKLTGVDNPNSPSQLKKWLSDAIGKDITTLAKDSVLGLLEEIDESTIFETRPNPRSEGEYASTMSEDEKKDYLGEKGYITFWSENHWIHKNESITSDFIGLGTDELVNILKNKDNFKSDFFTYSEIKEVLDGRLKLAKSSTKKYIAMTNCVCEDGRAHGLFQYQGASRTGRWSSRLIQLQNLPQNHLKELDLARRIISSGDYESCEMAFESIPNVLSELIRTALVAKPGYTFAIADFSAIEARVLSWAAQEKWRMDVFATHGKIYEASAAMMFNVPIEQVTKGSDLRQRGKTAELALGYEGGEGAMEQMDRDKKIPPSERKQIVRAWRNANPNIVKFWRDVEACAIRAITTKKSISLRWFKFHCDSEVFRIELPSGRCLSYRNPRIGVNRFGNPSIIFEGMDQVIKQWTPIETYGGKLVENIIQAVSRDLLAYAMQKLWREGHSIVMHIHDEIVNETEESIAEETLKRMEEIMAEEVPWAPGLPLKGDGYITKYYKKD